MLTHGDTGSQRGQTESQTALSLLDFNQPLTTTAAGPS